MLFGQLIVRSSACVEFIMQKTSRKQRVVAGDSVETNVVRLRRKSAATGDEVTARPAEIARIAALMERASNAVRQMKYFSVATKRFAFNELTLSAARAGFILNAEYPQLREASFEWGAGAPDLIFTVSYRDPARVSIVAESQGDIFGLVLTAYSEISTISVETNPTIADRELGENAFLFRDMLLIFPGFDDVPAWIRYPEIATPEAGGLVAMWRDGVSLASVFSRTWNSISARVVDVWYAFRDRS
jgi:hypothetical protein